MSQYLLAFNAGSASLKCAAFTVGGRPRFHLDIELGSGNCTAQGQPPTLPDFAGERFPDAIASAIVAALLREGAGIRACLHRLAHGGPRRRQPAMLDAALLEELAGLEALCPLQQPAALEIIGTLRCWRPELPQLAVFDSAFHLDQPRLARDYALPAALRRSGLRAYGGHGIACQSVLRQLQQRAPALAGGRLLIAHLGCSASLNAVQDGRSIASSQGFSSLDGIPTATHPGQLDPGILLHLLEKGWARSRLSDLLYHQSGLLGLSGRSGDMRELLASDDEQAAFAVAYFCQRVARCAASLAAAMQGLDGIVFTGGIGEWQPQLRARLVSQLGWLGAVIDADANAGNQFDIGGGGSGIRLHVLPAAEEAELFLQARPLLAARPAARGRQEAGACPAGSSSR